MSWAEVKVLKDAIENNSVLLSHGNKKVKRIVQRIEPDVHLQEKVIGPDIDGSVYVISESTSTFAYINQDEDSYYFHALKPQVSGSSSGDVLCFNSLYKYDMDNKTFTLTFMFDNNDEYKFEGRIYGLRFTTRGNSPLNPKFFSAVQMTNPNTAGIATATYIILLKDAVLLTPLYDLNSSSTGYDLSKWTSDSKSFAIIPLSEGSLTLEAYASFTLDTPGTYERISLPGSQVMPTGEKSLIYNLKNTEDGTKFLMTFNSSGGQQWYEVSYDTSLPNTLSFTMLTNDDEGFAQSRKDCYYQVSEDMAVVFSRTTFIPYKIDLNTNDITEMSGNERTVFSFVGELYDKLVNSGYYSLRLRLIDGVLYAMLYYGSSSGGNATYMTSYYIDGSTMWTQITTYTSWSTRNDNGWDYKRNEGYLPSKSNSKIVMSKYVYNETDTGKLNINKMYYEYETN